MSFLCPAYVHGSVLPAFDPRFDEVLLTSTTFCTGINEYKQAEQRQEDKWDGQDPQTDPRFGNFFRRFRSVLRLAFLQGQDPKANRNGACNPQSQGHIQVK